jgi:hypothetical protein
MRDAVVSAFMALIDVVKVDSIGLGVFYRFAGSVGTFYANGYRYQTDEPRVLSESYPECRRNS